MKLTQRWLVAVATLALMWLAPERALAANDYMEKQSHYLVYAKGADCIHIKVFTWAYGNMYNYIMTENAYFGYKIKGTNTTQKVAYYKCSDWNGQDKKRNGKGTAKVKLLSGQGDLFVTNMYNGEKKVMTATGGFSEQLYVKQDGDHARTVLEFDWYPPESLNTLDFEVLIHPDGERPYTASGGSHHWSKDFWFGEFTGGDNMLTPQLYEPYLYQVDENGVSGYGYAGVVYTTFYSTMGYTTSLHPRDTIRTTSRSDNILVMTNDTIQENFHADFKVYRNEQAGLTTVQRSTTVDIPPYHRIYNLQAVEDRDETGTLTGNNIISWTIKNPDLKDIVDGDYFEVERALNPDFSDAKQLTIVAMHEDQGAYSFTDESRDMWTGRNNDKINMNASSMDFNSVVYKDFPLTNSQGDTVMTFDFRMTLGDEYLPSLPVYYRVRRASASIWGWEHEFMAQTSMQKMSFLSPLAKQQERYTLARDYAQSHKVNFRIKIENKDVMTLMPTKEDVKWYIDPESMVYNESYRSDTIRVRVRNFYSKPFVYVAHGTWSDGSTMYTPEVKCYSRDTTLLIPREGGGLVMICDNELHGLAILSVSSSNYSRYTITIDEEGLTHTFKSGYENTDPRDGVTNENWLNVTDPGFTANFQRVKSALIDSLYGQLEVKEPTISFGKTTWDKTARLILIRTIEETGQKQEFIIPQDSIRRQNDGSWIATYSDVASQACMHYRYSVRIDPSQSDVRFQDPDKESLPVELSGPEVYYDEGATIRNFTASMGDASTAVKPGVMLGWTPSSSAVDMYVLQRRKMNSNESADTIYTGTDNAYFDRTAVPDVHYEYTVTALYNCNGKGTSNFSTAEGWRTPYGEISGMVVMSDQSGMNGVRVALQGPYGNVLRTMVTDATGRYRFDSLTYDIATSTDYVVVPTHQYGSFSFNNTGAGTASISLSADNAVANGLDFVNTETVRLTGRVLYQNSSIPVAGTMFLLNGDTVYRGTAPLKSGIDGNFELILTKNQPYTLRAVKPGHTFAGNGVLYVEGLNSEFALTKALDGVRFYDETKVRLVGRVAGGNDQRDLPAALGLGTNNLGDDLQIVLALEGDNTAQIVHDPNDPTLDTVMQQTDHIVYSEPDLAGGEPTRVVGTTHSVFEKKRITIHPDPQTGEYQIDLFPVKYKVVQVSARGYATLFDAGTGSETFDLTNAPLESYDVVHEGDSVHFNARYDRIYHNPVQVELVQNIYGIEREGFGEPQMEVSSLDPDSKEKVDLYHVQPDGTVVYTMGYPLFLKGKKYQFAAKAYEDYYYNNDMTGGILDRVPIRGGRVIVHNGMEGSTSVTPYDLDENGRNNVVWLAVDHLNVESYGEDALHTVTVALEQEGNTVETNVFQAYIVGTLVEEKTLHSTPSDIHLLDIVRDPGGSGSFAYVESGTTYKFGFTTKTKAEYGVQLTPTWGTEVTTHVGIVSAPQGTGSYTGQPFVTNRTYNFTIPVTHKYDYGYEYAYTITTKERITTSSSTGQKGVGSNADVFMGVTLGQLSGTAKTICVIGDSLYQMRQPAINAGAMQVLAHGVDSTGAAYHLVIGSKIVLGTQLDHTFVYTQRYILETLIPQLALERQNLLMSFSSAEEAQAAAEASGKPVYWYHETGTYLNDTLPVKAYDMFTPLNDSTYTDEVAAINNMLMQWITIVMQNEREKIEARTTGQLVGTYSVSTEATYSHTDSYAATSAYNEIPQGWQLIADAQTTTTKVSTNFMASLPKLSKYLQKSSSTAADALADFYTDEVNAKGDGFEQKQFKEIGTKTNSSKFYLQYNPVLDYNEEHRTSNNTTLSKETGFTIKADQLGDITVSVYRAHWDSTWVADTYAVRENVEIGESDDAKYGSYVFFTQAGTSFCPHEEEEYTELYNPGTLLNNGTRWAMKPELSANTYEIANVSPDKRAAFRIMLYNNGEVDTGVAANGERFCLFLDPLSNPDGAKVYLDGAPLNTNPTFWITPGAPVTATLEVERGSVDDYNLTIGMYVESCFKTRAFMDLAVHFIPVSSDVEIASPRQNWVMNTLSQQDSAGYYIPVSIEGFDIYHKNFDHIEFQYKLSTESEERWVNQCSFYASDSLYALATGNKAMIENGRIVPFRFYGERDPMEQRYDLRAVSFCRYGSGFVSKASPVISGVKDTRPPRVFGEPEPANSILSVGSNLLLRFNEPIAGNYLDEDNNFQLMGVTNETGITASTALHFNGDSKAETKVKRDFLSDSFSIDMLIRPEETERAKDMKLFETYCEANKTGLSIYLTRDNRIGIYPKAQQGNYTMVKSERLGSLLEYTRIVVTRTCNDGDMDEFHVYAGTEDLTGDRMRFNWPTSTSSAVWTFGEEYQGDMLEARIWTKALTQEEIAATANHYLSGFERELLGYYRMDEGRGEVCTDRANGATLYLEGCSWNLQKGWSLNIPAGKQVQLAGNLLGRSAVYDETLMFWFRTATNGTLYQADRRTLTDTAGVVTHSGTRIALEDGALMLYSDNQKWKAAGTFNDDEWHHFVLTVNRTFDNASIFIDGNMLQTFPASRMGGITGPAYMGGDGFAGHIDEFAIFEQALPKDLVLNYDLVSPYGDEMGLMAYLPFEEQVLNPNGILEQVFSVNDRRQFRDPNGEVIDKEVPLVLGNTLGMEDNVNAPLSDAGLLSKLRFDWSFNQDELMINVLNQDREVNKQTIYITVRDVEDLNGNPMASPVTWVAFVDRNSLKWEDDDLEYKLYYSDIPNEYNYTDFRIVNNSGKRHQYTVESLPSWLTVDKPTGSIDPMEDKTLRFYFDDEMPVGEYTNMIYLTDENGLAEPLEVHYQMTAICPWGGVDTDLYPNTMNLCGQVRIYSEDGSSAFDTDPEDVVAAFCNGNMVGSANNSFDNNGNKSMLYLTIHGNGDMTGKIITFKLWQASTGKVFNLRPSSQQRYQNNAIRGYAPDDPVQLSTYAGETQQVTLGYGWNWISFYLYPRPDSLISSLFTEDQGWQTGDMIKTPSERQVAQFDDGTWKGTLSTINFRQMYMAKSVAAVTISIDGKKLTDAERTVTLYNGWSSMAYLLDEPMSVQDALADYLGNAREGDVIKSKTAVAVFSKNRRWEGSLQTMRPGQGYLFRRLSPGTVTMTYYPKPTAKASSRAPLDEGRGSSRYATNMTMVVRMDNGQWTMDNGSLLAYLGDELAGEAVPQVVDGDTLYFLTIASDQEARVRFTTSDGRELSIVNLPQSSINHPFVNYKANAHHGTLSEPVVLAPVDDLQPMKVLENGILYILMPDGTRYDATGKELK